MNLALGDILLMFNGIHLPLHCFLVMLTYIPAQSQIALSLTSVEIGNRKDQSNR